MQPAHLADGHAILCLNSGSSSLKFALYHLGEETEVRLAHGAVERIGLDGGHLWLRGADHEAWGGTSRFPRPYGGGGGGIRRRQGLGFPPPAAVGHRVVHGGPDYTAPERVDTQLLADLRRLVAFAPLHLPGAFRASRRWRRASPGCHRWRVLTPPFTAVCRRWRSAFPFPATSGMRVYGGTAFMVCPMNTSWRASARRPRVAW